MDSLYPPAPPPMMPPPSPQFAIDADHLRLLSIFHYVHAGLLVIFGCIPIIHVGMGIMMLSAKFPPVPASAAAPGGAAFPGFPSQMGWFFVVLGSFAIIACQTMAVLNFLAGKWIAARRKSTFCQVVAGINCLHMPLGTILGIFTFIVMQRPSVRALFQNPGVGI